MPSSQSEATEGCNIFLLRGFPRHTFPLSPSIILCSSSEVNRPRTAAGNVADRCLLEKSIELQFHRVGVLRSDGSEACHGQLEAVQCHRLRARDGLGGDWWPKR